MPAKTFKKYLSEKLLSEFFGYQFSIKTAIQELNEKASPKLVPKASAAPKMNKSAADAKGKLVELMLGAAASNGIKNGKIVKFANDFRKKGQQSKDIHDALVNSLYDGNDQHPEYQKKLKATVDAHKKFQSKFLKPGEKITKAHWTSQPGDMAKAHGYDDPNSKGDVSYEITNAKKEIRHKPASAKIGHGDPNFANNGVKTLAFHSGTDEMAMSNYWNAHTKDMEKHYGSNSSLAQRQSMGKMDEKMAKEGIESIRKYHKELSSKEVSGQDKARLEAASNILNAHDKAKTPKEKSAVIDASINRHKAATNSSIAARTNIAKELASGFNKGKPEESHARIHNGLKNMAAPTSVNGDALIVLHQHKNGDIHPHVFDSEELVRNHLNQYHGLHAEASGISVHYYGVNKQTGKREKVATHGLKQGNGPHAGWNSTLQAKDIVKNAIAREESSSASAETNKAISKAKAKSTVQPVNVVKKKTL